jgi:hypothetical protein
MEVSVIVPRASKKQMDAVNKKWDWARIDGYYDLGVTVEIKRRVSGKYKSEQYTFETKEEKADFIASLTAYMDWCEGKLRELKKKEMRGGTE